MTSRSFLPPALLASVLLTAGCAATHGIEPQAAMPEPATMALAAASTDDTAIAADWWTALGDARLNAVVADALAGNPSLKVAAARVRGALAAAGQAEAAQGPVVDFSAAFQRQRYSANGLTPPPLAGNWENLGQASLNFGYEFDWWGKFAARTAAAHARVDAAGFEARQARLVLVSALAGSYAQLADTVEQARLARAEAARLDAGLTVLGRQVGAGIAAQEALASARANRARKDSDIAQLDARAEVLRHQLAALAGKGPAAYAGLTPAPLPDPARLRLPAAPTLDRLAARPDVAAARASAAAASEETKAARAMFYPSVSLSAFAGTSAVEAGDLLKRASYIAGIAPALDLPIFNAGALRANLGARAAQQDSATEQYAATLIDAARDAADQLAGVGAAAQGSAASQRARAEEARVAGIAARRFQAGLGSRLASLSAETQQLAAERAAGQARAAEWLARIALVRALGGGDAPARQP